MARLTAPNGVTVEVPKEKVDGLLARGFTADATKTAAKKPSSSSKASK